METMNETNPEKGMKLRSSRMKIIISIIIAALIVVGLFGYIIYSNNNSLILKNEYKALLSKPAQSITIKCLAAMQKAYSGDRLGLTYSSDKAMAPISSFKSYYELTSTLEQKVLYPIYYSISEISWMECEEVLGYTPEGERMQDDQVIFPDTTREKGRLAINMIIEYYCEP